MKKLILILTLIFFSVTSVELYGQLPVTDVATQASLTITNTQLQAMQTTLNSDNRQIINELQKLNRALEKNNELQTDIRDRQKREEDALFIVPPHIKNSPQINTILDTEVNVLRLITQLRNIANNLQNINVNSLVQPIMSMMNREVDYAVKICTDNVYRMSTDERIDYLKTIETKMVNAEQLLMNRIKELSLQAERSERDRQDTQKAKQQHQNLMNSTIQPQN